MLAAGCLLAGCTKQSPWNRIALQGDVTVSEIPSAEDVNGTLTIVPAAGKKGPAAVTAITAGKYQFTATNGPVSGDCEVVVRLFQPVPLEPGAKPGAKPVHTKPMPSSPGAPVRATYLPDKKKSIQVPVEKAPHLDLDW